jgi:hypothetical protein
MGYKKLYKETLLLRSQKEKAISDLYLELDKLRSYIFGVKNEPVPSDGSF